MPEGRRRSWWRWPTASLRAYFMAVIIVATVPMTALASYLIAQEVLAAREQMETGLERSAAAFALTVEREMVSSIEALSILAYSDSLQRDDVAGFFGTLTSLPKMRATWDSAFLVNLDGEVLFNTHQPAGKTLDKVGDAKALERLKVSGKPVLTDLIEGPEGRMTTGVLVPVTVNGELKYALGAWISPASWRGLMSTVSESTQGFTTIFDARMAIVARSRSAERFAGKPIPASTQTLVRQQRVGLGRIELLEGGQAYAAWQMLPGAGWGVLVGLPAEPIDRAHAGSVALALGTGLLSLGAGLLLALLVARRVTNPLQALAAQNTPPPEAASEVRELALLQEALRSSEAQREAARHRLQAKADELETLFHNSPIGLAMAQDAECRHVLLNPALTVMLEGTGQDHGLRPLRQAASTGERQQDVELEIVHQDGRALRLIAHAVPLFDAQGRPRGAIGAYTDITERQLAEESLKQTERRLRESQHLVELAQAAGHVGFFDHDFQSRRVTWTSGMAHLFGLESGDYESPIEDWVHRIDAQDRPSVRRAVQQAIEDQREVATFEFRTRHPDGLVRWLSTRAMLSYDRDGKPLHMNGVVVDITQQKTVDQARAQLVAREQEARKEAESANRAKDEFLAMLGHELRNPLGAIAAASEVLNRVDPQHEMSVRARLIITRQTRHLARLMDDLLDVARVIAGKILLMRQPLHLGHTAQRLLHTMEMSGLLKNHKVSVHVEDAWIHADSTRIEQVINNLLSNAIKYTPPGGSIDLSVKREGEQAVLRVADTGEGMSPELIARVFDLFVQGDRTLDRRQGGLGIGLTLVKRLTELHGGQVEVSSPGAHRGSAFTITLPLAQPPEGTSSLPPSAKAEAPRRVVVIEDNDDAREALCAMLTLSHHECAAAPDGEQGLQLVLRTQPDLALVDIGLPGLNGYQVAHHLRATGFKGRLVAVSGYGQLQDIEKAKASGFDQHLVKPIDPQALDSLLASLAS